MSIDEANSSGRAPSDTSTNTDASTNNDSNTNILVPAPGTSAPERPTWSEVEQTRTKVKNRQALPTDHTPARLCIVTHSYIDPTPSGPPLTGRLVCLENLTRQMAQAQLQQRKTQPWTDRWGLRWLTRWQIVRVRGTQNITEYAKFEGKGIVSQRIVRDILPDEEERKKFVRVEAMDQAIVRWQGEAQRFAWEVVQPGVRMCGMLKDSWTSGMQRRYFAMFWRDAREMSALRLAGKMVAHVGSIFDDDHDGKVN
ncbi:hypothetical protein BX661DRAFT_171906 [Kickxella alabastrina]|uniref:uncharacterized protein n=1 Tax=Kickxella alabastrina TaxID=61397 RepID=UPI00222002D1|nr:uncharacterized protein BX661DRAFT_171906 [Kickxella alabastrina]KAI7825956.1 hypothetical protein BX661DRAFT_171906 [Kickxella alabastrina]KAJ1946618.1 hypothetical protein GGF37_001054 [Kickxella alabastrina]